MITRCCNESSKKLRENELSRIKDFAVFASITTVLVKDNLGWTPVSMGLIYFAVGVGDILMQGVLISARNIHSRGAVYRELTSQYNHSLRAVAESGKRGKRE